MSSHGQVVLIIPHGFKRRKERRTRVERYPMNLTGQHVDGMRFLAATDKHAVVVDASPERVMA
jgi:secreted PhoX family phosphatase